MCDVQMIYVCIYGKYSSMVGLLRVFSITHPIRGLWAYLEDLPVDRQQRDINFYRT